MIAEFTGKERDAETGLDYFGARYLSAAQGRFTSPDIPFIDQHTGAPQTWNLYTYVRNNPLSYTDPDGHCTTPALAVTPPCQFVFRQADKVYPYADRTLKAGGGLVWSLFMAMQAANADGKLGTPDMHGGPSQDYAVEQMKADKEGNSGQPPNPDGNKGKKDHQEKVAELKKKAEGEAKPGEQVLQERKIQGHDSKRKPDVQIVDERGRTRKVFEAERHPTHKRNKAREVEYKRLEIPQETHKVQ